MFGVKTGELLKVDDIKVGGMTFVCIPPGEFLMGSPENESGRRSSELLHRVVITKGVNIQDTAVTVGLWRKFVIQQKYRSEAECNGGAWKLVEDESWNLQKIFPRYDWKMSEKCAWYNPGFLQCEDSPVTCVSWNDTQEFIRWLNKSNEFSFRLPTEAEWEYACRAGSRTPYSFGRKLSIRQGNMDRRFIDLYKRYPSFRFLHKNRRTYPVSHHASNAWNLHSMHGNVWEWCQDRSEGIAMVPETYIDDICDPLNETGSERVLRGGSWAYPKQFCRSAARRSQLPDYRASGIGFRLVVDRKSQI